MSWQGYVDNLLQSQKIDKAVLCSRAGDSVWAHSAGFEPTSTELLSIAKAFDDPSELQTTGLRAQGEKYFLIRSDDRSIYGKQGEDGLLCVRTKQTILIAHYSKPVLPFEAIQVTEGMADYLISVSY